MATIGLDKLYYSKITEGATGDETYATPVSLAKAIDADLAIELLEAVLYADDGADTAIKEFKSGTLTLGIDDIGVQSAQDLTGAVLDTNGVLISSGEDTPAPVAIGFRAKAANGHYRYFWLYRVLFGNPRCVTQNQRRQYRVFHSVNRGDNNAQKQTRWRKQASVESGGHRWRDRCFGNDNFRVVRQCVRTRLYRIRRD